MIYRNLIWFDLFQCHRMSYFFTRLILLILYNIMFVSSIVKLISWIDAVLLSIEDWYAVSDERDVASFADVALDSMWLDWKISSDFEISCWLRYFWLFFNSTFFSFFFFVWRLNFFYFYFSIWFWFYFDNSWRFLNFWDFDKLFNYRF